MKKIPNIPSDFQTFVATIAGDVNAEVTFQTFGDKDKARSLAKVSHGRPAEMYDQLLQWNDQGRGIFMMINKGDLKGRSARNVIEVRAVFADFDETPYDPDNISLLPHLVVVSSPGRYHVYWLVSDCPVGQFKTVQKAIAVKFGSDAAVHDLSRVMRVPGFCHHKKEPFFTHIVERNDIPVYTLEEIVNSLGLELSSVHHTFSQKGGNSNFLALNGFEVVDKNTGEFFDLVKWAKRHPDFLVVDALRFHEPEVLLGQPRDDKQHIRCPFNNEHTDESDDNATYCVNGADPKEDNTGFVIHCRHDHCADRDRLDYIRKILELGWLPLEALTDKNFLAERRRPQWVKNHLDHWERSQGYNSLTPIEQGHFLRFERICLCTGDGQCKDDEWLLARQLGLAYDEWQELRATYIRCDLLKAENGYLVNDHILDAYEDSRQSCEKSARAGREGGKSKASA